MEFTFIKTKKKNILQALGSNFIKLYCKKNSCSTSKKKNLTNQYQHMDPLSGGWENSIKKT